MDDHAEPRLPPAPPALLAALRDAESRLEDLDALRAQLRTLRLALEESPVPTAEDVIGRIDYTAGLSDHVEISDAKSVEILAPTTTAEARVVGQGKVTATGRVDAATPPAEVKSWLVKVREMGPALYKVPDLVLRAYSTFHGGPPPG